MDIKFISEEAYKDLLNRVDQLTAAVNKVLNKQLLEDRWIENNDGAIMLGVSKRWLQSRRSNGEITYSKIEGRIYYRASDLQKMMEDNMVKRKPRKHDNGDGDYSAQIV